MDVISTQAEPNSAQQSGLIALQQQCLNVLERLSAASSSVKFASLSLIDGRAFAHANGHGNVDGARIAALATSLLGLSESFAKEALAGSNTHTVVAVDCGAIVTVRVPSKRRLFALSVCADLGENLATVLRRTLDAADGLARLVDGSEHLK